MNAQRQTCEPVLVFCCFCLFRSVKMKSVAPKYYAQCQQSKMQLNLKSLDCSEQINHTHYTLKFVDT